MKTEIKEDMWVTYPYEFDEERKVITYGVLCKVLKVDENRNAHLLKYLSYDTFVVSVDNLPYFSTDESIKEYEEKLRETARVLDEEGNEVYGERAKKLFDRKRALWYKEMEDMKGEI